ncbi:MAG: glycosyltransferase [Chitinophagaceae bacterium]
MSALADIAVVIPTRNRVAVLHKALDTLAAQTLLPAEVIIVDASDEQQVEVRQQLTGAFAEKGVILNWVKATQQGAAAQRNQGVALARYPFILFMDDDAYLEPDVAEKLWTGMQTLPRAGGINAMIKNQQYTTPGTITRWMCNILSDKKAATYAGRIIGPAWNLLPEDRDDLPEYVPCEWLNTTCTLYRKEALPSPVFQSHFTGYSLMEDVSLSVQVGKSWGLYNARTARIYHDSQPGQHKSSVYALARMELVNRHYVMTKVLERRSAKDYFRFYLFQLFGIGMGLTSAKGWKNLFPTIFGKLSGFIRVLK